MCVFPVWLYHQHPVRVFHWSRPEQHRQVFEDTAVKSWWNSKCSGELGREVEFVSVGRDGTNTAVGKWFPSHWGHSSSKQMQLVYCNVLRTEMTVQSVIKLSNKMHWLAWGCLATCTDCTLCRDCALIIQTVLSRCSRLFYSNRSVCVWHWVKDECNEEKMWKEKL